MINATFWGAIFKGLRFFLAKGLEWFGESQSVLGILVELQNILRKVFFGFWGNFRKRDPKNTGAL